MSTSRLTDEPMRATYIYSYDLSLGIGELLLGLRLVVFAVNADGGKSRHVEQVSSSRWN